MEIHSRNHFSTNLTPPLWYMEKPFSHPLLKPEDISDEEKKLIFPQELILTHTTQKNLEKILYPILEGRNVLLIGDAGIGKNALVYYLNRLRQLPTIRFSFNQESQAEDLIGGYRILPQGFHWSDGPLVYAMKKGYTFVADEMNLAPPEILKRFLSVLDKKMITLYEKDNQKIIAHRRFHWVATQNPSRGFEGRKIIPETIRSYFTIIHLDPYPLQEEVEIILGLFPQADENLVKKQILLQRELENLLKQNELARDDFEHYHFNLRTAQRFWTRLKRKTHDEKEFIKNLLRHYALIFQKKSDVNKTLGLISEIFGYPSNLLEQIRQDYYTCHKKSFLYYPPGGLDVFPFTKKRLALLEEIEQSLEAGENLLIEVNEGVHPEPFLEILAQRHGQKIEFIYLSRSTQTGDIIGSLRPIESSVGWVDGPLTTALKEGKWVVLDNPEACGSEIVEKLNMLLDHAGMLLLPAEASEVRAIEKPKNFRLIAIKRHRKSRNIATLSRAFRNRFFSLQIPAIETLDELSEALDIVMKELFFGYDLTEIKEKILLFHQKVNEFIENTEIGGGSERQFFGEVNILRLVGHIAYFSSKSELSFTEIIDLGVEIHYIACLANLEDREKVKQIWKAIRDSLPMPMLEKVFLEMKKKRNLKPNFSRKITWNPEENYRKPITGRAQAKLSGRELKKGWEIDTPETGGDLKEGKDAWYGKDTWGNRGNGIPQGGGGGWGYRTEELFKQFLARYKPKWDYNLNLDFEEFQEFFKKAILDYDMDFHNRINQRKLAENNFKDFGYRIHTRKYISYLTGGSNSRIFVNNYTKPEEPNIEVIVFLNKGRRIFNSQTAIAAVVAVQCTLEILWDLKIPVRVFGYSDFINQRKNLDIIEYGKQIYGSLDIPGYEQRKATFTEICQSWHGDTVEEYPIIASLPQFFRQDIPTRVAILISDFRGHRARKSIQQQLLCQESQLLKKEIENVEKLGYTVFGVQTGGHNLASSFFSHSIWLHENNLYKAPVIFLDSLLALLDVY